MEYVGETTIAQDLDIIIFWTSLFYSDGGMEVIGEVRTSAPSNKHQPLSASIRFLGESKFLFSHLFTSCDIVLH
jgi:hypothetical protein